MSRTLLLATMLLLAVTRGESAPLVVSTIKPLQSLAGMVMQDIAEPVLLIPANISPHNYRMTPSGAKQLQQANLVLWVGPPLESKLTKPLATLVQTAQILTLIEEPELKILPARRGGTHNAEDDHDHHTGIDPHLWLDPDNAIVILKLLCRYLSKTDPENAAQYRANTKNSISKIQAMDQEISASLTNLQDRPYLVLHDAFQYFESHYNLAQAGAITANPERKPSAKRIQALRTSIHKNNIACVFTEPQFGTQLANIIIEGTTTQIATLDPIGASIKSTQHEYIALMEQLATNLVDCLSNP